jgi:hypothetical protein
MPKDQNRLEEEDPGGQEEEESERCHCTQENEKNRD